MERKREKGLRITVSQVPFYFLLEIKEIENNGIITVGFYETGENKIHSNRVTEKSFKFGESGRYYEYILFFDRVDNIFPGRHCCAIFYNSKLIYEDYIEIAKDRSSNHLP